MNATYQKMNTYIRLVTQAGESPESKPYCAWCDDKRPGTWHKSLELAKKAVVKRNPYSVNVSLVLGPDFDVQKVAQQLQTWLG